jgi:signal transduction histidine kinase/FixJ family two-component response regulator
MQATASVAPSVDSSQEALAFLHRLLSRPVAEQPALADLLAELATAFAAPRAGLAALPDGAAVALHPCGQASTVMQVPWQVDPEVLQRVCGTPAALVVPGADGGSSLLTAFGHPEQGGWVLWLTDTKRPGWTEGEGAALVLAGHVFQRGLTSEATPPRWAGQLDRILRQQRLEAAARVVRRLAHDFGNVLTGILGFSELALTQQVASGTALHAYLTEVYRGAQNGAQFTNQLRLFARRQNSNTRSCNPAQVVWEEESRLRGGLAKEANLKVELPADLPAVGVDADHLRQVLGVLLENARDALIGPGSITVSTRKVELKAADCRDLFGDVRPGPHVEIRVTDTGSGLSAEARKHLFLEPFFTTRPRKRGFGLAIAYGILAAHRGGLDLLPHPERGTVARLVLPVAEIPAPVAPAPANHREKILLVADDPMVLQFATLTLERAGYRVQATASPQEAVRLFASAGAEPFRLLLTDVVMPHLDGVTLARRVLEQDARTAVLLMSGHAPATLPQSGSLLNSFDLLAKPFRAEELVRRVRAALDRGTSSSARPGASGDRQEAGLDGARMATVSAVGGRGPLAR